MEGKEEIEMMKKNDQESKGEKHVYDRNKP